MSGVVEVANIAGAGLFGTGFALWRHVAKRTSAQSTAPDPVRTREVLARLVIAIEHAIKVLQVQRAVILGMLEHLPEPA